MYSSKKVFGCPERPFTLFTSSYVPLSRRSQPDFENPSPLIVVSLFSCIMSLLVLVTFLVISNQFACGKSTVCGIVADVTEAILQHLTNKYIRFSTTEQAMRSIEFWRAKTGIPGVVACLDGCHIQIIRPSKSGTAYFNRKGF